MENKILIEVYCSFFQDENLRCFKKKELIENTFESKKEFISWYYDLERISDEDGPNSEDELNKFLNGEANIFYLKVDSDYDDPSGYEFRTYTKKEKIKELKSQIDTIENFF